MKLITTLCIALVSVSTLAAPKFTDENCIRAAIGEAGNQGHEGLLAVSCAIRNRKTLNGVYGFNSKQIDLQPAYVWIEARKAWTESKYKDVTRGAKYWGSKTDIETAKFYKKLTFTVKVKDHWFFKE